MRHDHAGRLWGRHACYRRAVRACLPRACQDPSRSDPLTCPYLQSLYRNTTGALSLTYDTEKKLLAVGETSGDILVFKTGKPDAVCCLHLPVSRGKLSARVSSVLLDRPLAPLDGSEGRGKAVAVTCLRPWIATEAANSVLLASCECAVQSAHNAYLGTMCRQGPESNGGSTQMLMVIFVCGTSRIVP